MRLAQNSKKGEIAYGVVAAVMWLTYVATAIYGELKRRKAGKNTPEPYDKAGVRQYDESQVLGGNGSGHESSPDRNREYYGKEQTEGHRYV